MSTMSLSPRSDYSSDMDNNSHIINSVEVKQEKSSKLASPFSMDNILGMSAKSQLTCNTIPARTPSPEGRDPGAASPSTSTSSRSSCESPLMDDSPSGPFPHGDHLNSLAAAYTRAWAAQAAQVSQFLPRVPPQFTQSPHQFPFSNGKNKFSILFYFKYLNINIDCFFFLSVLNLSAYYFKQFI